jgi:hypothetical protein
MIPTDTVLLEVVAGGKRVERQRVAQPTRGPLYLLLVRRKGRILWGTSHDRATSPVAVKAIAVEMPNKVKVGLTASNISATPLTATFENFALLSDPGIIDTKLADEGK